MSRPVKGSSQFGVDDGLQVVWFVLCSVPGFGVLVLMGCHWVCASWPPSDEELGESTGVDLRLFADMLKPRNVCS